MCNQTNMSASRRHKKNITSFPFLNDWQQVQILLPVSHSKWHHLFLIDGLTRLLHKLAPRCWLKMASFLPNCCLRVMNNKMAFLPNYTTRWRSHTVKTKRRTTKWLLHKMAPHCLLEMAPSHQIPPHTRPRTLNNAGIHGTPCRFSLLQ